MTTFTDQVILENTWTIVIGLVDDIAYVVQNKQNRNYMQVIESDGIPTEDDEGRVIKPYDSYNIKKIVTVDMYVRYPNGGGILVVNEGLIFDG